MPRERMRSLGAGKWLGLKSERAAWLLGRLRINARGKGFDERSPRVAIVIFLKFRGESGEGGAALFGEAATLCAVPRLVICFRGVVLAAVYLEEVECRSNIFKYL